MAELVRRYADLPLGAVDASVVAVAERTKITTVATLDHRHFHIVRPSTPTHSPCYPTDRQTPDWYRTQRRPTYLYLPELSLAAGWGFIDRTRPS